MCIRDRATKAAASGHLHEGVGGFRPTPLCGILCGYVAMRLYGSVAMYLCRYVAIWLCGYVAKWLSGYVGKWAGVCMTRGGGFLSINAQLFIHSLHVT